MARVNSFKVKPFGRMFAAAKSWLPGRKRLRVVSCCGAKRKRRGQALILSVEGRASKNDLSLHFAQERGRISTLRMQTFVQFVTRNQIREQHGSRAGKTARLNRLAKRFGSAPGWDDDGGRPGVSRAHTADEVGLHPLQVRHPHKAGDAWGDHRFEGGVVSRSSSSPAF